MSLADLDGARLALAINLELSHGRHGASARVELLERAGRHVARIGLSGWVEEIAIGRFENAVSELAARDVDGVILDCSRLRHVNAGSASRLTRALAPFASRRQGLVLQGLSMRLRERLEQSDVAVAAVGPALAPAVVGREWTS